MSLFFFFIVQVAPDCKLISSDDIPEDGRLILNVRIPDTETSDSDWQPGVNVRYRSSFMADLPNWQLINDSNSTHHQRRFASSVDEAFPPIYCVHYDGIYLQPVTPPGTSNGSADSSGWKSFRYIVQPRIVKRRFKVRRRSVWSPDSEGYSDSFICITANHVQEFINLESRLESSPKLGPLVRDLERPTTWLRESGCSDLTVEARREFLERFIAALCGR